MNTFNHSSINTSRKLNTFKLLSCLHNSPNLSVSELSERTEIPQPTVYRLLHQLLENHLLLETAKLDTPNGRKAVLYAINPSFAYYICIVLEKSTLALYVADLSGSVIDGVRVKPVLPCSREEYLALLTGQLDTMLAKLKSGSSGRQRILMLGVAAEADTNRESGKILQFSGLHCLDDFDIVNYLQKRYQIPSILEKHLMVEAASSISTTLGYACQNYIYLHIGAGIGANIVIDGKHYLGANGKAGELVRICRENGESWESAFNTANLYQQLMHLSNAAPGSSLNNVLLNELAAPVGDHIHPLMRVLEYALRIRDPDVTALVSQAASGWAEMITTLYAFYDPAVIIVGGDISAGTPEVFSILQHQLEEYPHFNGTVLPINYCVPPEHSIASWFLHDAFLQIFAVAPEDR